LLHREVIGHLVEQRRPFRGRQVPELLRTPGHAAGNGPVAVVKSQEVQASSRRFCTVSNVGLGAVAYAGPHVEEISSGAFLVLHFDDPAGKLAGQFAAPFLKIIIRSSMLLGIMSKENDRTSTSVLGEITSLISTVL
jgi:hypothetical protein